MCQLARPLDKSRWSSSLRDLMQRMTRREPSQRPCLGTVLGRKCRARNERVCDGSNPAECLYGSAASPLGLGACFMHLQAGRSPAAVHEGENPHEMHP